MKNQKSTKTLVLNRNIVSALTGKALGQIKGGTRTPPNETTLPQEFTVPNISTCACLENQG